MSEQGVSLQCGGGVLSVAMVMDFKCYLCADYLKPIAAEERRIEEEEKKVREEQERIAKQLAEGKDRHIQIHFKMM